MCTLKLGSVRRYISPLTLLCFVLVALASVIYPLFAGPGPVNTRGGGDSPFLFVRLEQLVAGLKAGAFPVRWMPDAAYGLGYPFFSFYAALPYYVAALFRFLGWGPILSLQVTQALGFVLAALAMALLARRLFDHPAAVTLAVVAYTVAPFHLVNVYVRGDSLSEFYAFVFFPLILWALLRLRDRPSWPNVAWLGLSYGGLILTHNLSALMFSPFVAAFALFLLCPRSLAQAVSRFLCKKPFDPGNLAILHNVRDTARKTALMLTGGLLGLALSAGLWLAAAGDMRAVWMGSRDIQTTGYFNYQGHLRGLDLVQPRFLFDYDVTAGSTPFAMGAVQAALVAAGIAVLFAWRWGKRGAGNAAIGGGELHCFWIIGFAFSTLMIVKASQILWDHVPMLPNVQFPWRFLSVQALFGALILGAAVRRLPRPHWIALIAAALLTLSAVGGLRPEYLPVGEADVTAEQLALFESFSANIGTTIRGEWLPASVEPRPYSSAVALNHGDKPAPMALSGQLIGAKLLHHDAQTERWRVEAAEGTRLAFYTLFFPGWQARIDGQRATIAPLPNSGLIALDVPDGEHEIELRFVRTPLRWAADLLSLSGFVVCAALLLGHFTRRVFRPANWAAAALWQVWKPALLGAVLLAGIVLLGRLHTAAGDAPRSDDLSMDFDRLPFLHHNPGGIDFGGQARLGSYGYSTKTVRGGEALIVTLAWTQAQPGWTAEVQLVSPADAHPGFTPSPPPLAMARTPIEETISLALAVPADAASGMYNLALRVFDGQEEVKAVATQGNTLGVTYLRPVWIENPRPAQASDAVRAWFGDILLRDDVQVQADGSSWDVQLTWQATRPISINYTCSLRMLAADGMPLPNAQRDFESGPGYGFWPTTAWPAGEWLTDRLRLPIPSGVQAGDAAALVIVLYDRSQPSFPAAGSVVIPLVEREHRYAAPEMTQTVGADFGGQVKLLGYDLAQDTTSWRLTLHWQALAQMNSDYTVFVHLFDQATNQIAAQADVRPLNGLYPTRWWRTGEVVSDAVTLSLQGVAPGRYVLAVGLYDPANEARLLAVDAPDGRLILERDVVVH